MGWLANLLNLFIILTSLFLIGVVLIQRGKGGGLAGAFGGVGGSSPFGSKAGDAFTKFTCYVALVWGLLIMIQVRVMDRQSATDTGENLPGVRQENS
jgi:preprotein translocase subunit SecG